VGECQLGVGPRGRVAIQQQDGVADAEAARLGRFDPCPSRCEPEGQTTPDRRLPSGCARPARSTRRESSISVAARIPSPGAAGGRRRRRRHRRAVVQRARRGPMGRWSASQAAGAPRTPRRARSLAGRVWAAQTGRRLPARYRRPRPWLARSGARPKLRGVARADSGDRPAIDAPRRHAPRPGPRAAPRPSQRARARPSRQQPPRAPDPFELDTVRLAHHLAASQISENGSK